VSYSKFRKKFDPQNYELMFSPNYESIEGRRASIEKNEK